MNVPTHLHRRAYNTRTAIGIFKPQPAVSSPYALPAITLFQRIWHLIKCHHVCTICNLGGTHFMVFVSTFTGLNCYLGWCFKRASTQSGTSKMKIPWTTWWHHWREWCIISTKEKKYNPKHCNVYTMQKKRRKRKKYNTNFQGHSHQRVMWCCRCEAIMGIPAMYSLLGYSSIFKLAVGCPSVIRSGVSVAEHLLKHAFHFQAHTSAWFSSLSNCHNLEDKARFS